MIHQFLILAIQIAKQETESFDIEVNYKQQQFMRVYFGMEREQYTELQIDYEYRDIIVGNKNDSDWGINCNEDIQCSFQEDVHYEKYKSENISFFKATVPISVANHQKISQINLLTKNQTFNNQKGIIGFSPNAVFWSLFQNQKYFNLSYDITKEGKKQNDWKIKIRVDQNFIDDMIIVEQKNHYDNFWSIQATFNESQYEQAFCLNFESDMFFNFRGGDDFCENIFYDLCGEKQCSKNSFNIKKLPTLTVNIKGKLLKIYPSEYIVEHEQKLLCLIDKEDESPCTYSLGKRFLEIYKPVLKFQEEGRSIMFIKGFEENNDLGILRILVWILLSVVVVLLLSFIFVIKQPKKHEIYRQIVQKQAKIGQLNFS